MGRILETLKERGIDKNTLVTFTSDNGFNCAHHGFWGKGNGTYPINMYDNSIRVPAIFRHPSTIPSGIVTDIMVSQYDFMATVTTVSYDDTHNRPIAGTLHTDRTSRLKDNAISMPNDLTRMIACLAESIRRPKGSDPRYSQSRLISARHTTVWVKSRWINTIFVLIG